MSVHKLRNALILMGAFVVLLYALQVVNWADSYRLDAEYGILPHNVGRLGEIFSAPFLHASWQHLEGNTVPLFILGLLAAYRSVARFLAMSFVVALTSGLAVWLFQSSGTLTVGASGLVFGYLGYVVVRGFFDKRLLDIGAGVVAGLLYWTILAVALPGTPGISWLAHLGGLIGGLIAAWALRTRTAPAVVGPRGWATGWTTGLERGPQSDRPQSGRPRPGQAQPGAAPGQDAPRRPASPGGQSVDDLLRELKDQGF